MGYFDNVKRPPVAVVAPLPDIETGQATSYAAAALRKECEHVAGLGQGQRNQELNKAAFRMGRHVGAGNIDAATVRAALTEAGRACGLPDHEIELVLRDDPTSGLANGTAVPRHPAPRDPIPEATVFDASIVNEDGTVDISAHIRKQFPLLDWHELWNTEDEEEEWIIEPILPARRLVALFSAPKVGKSLLMLEMAVGIARGSEVLSVTPERPRKVLYVDFENDPRGDVRERLRAMGARPDDLDNLCYLSYPTLAKLDTSAGATELMAIVAEYGCEVVVIDTISRAVGGEENENDTWLAFYRHTGLALKQAGVACIRLDHTGKDHEKGMRGGSAKYGDVDAVWKLSKVDGETFQLTCNDHRMPLTETEIVVTRLMNPLRHKVAGDARAAAGGAKVAAVIATLDAQGAPRDIGRRAAKQILVDNGQHAGSSTIDKALEQRRLVVGFAAQEEL